MNDPDLSRSPLAGSLVADAIAMPVHWYYDREALRRDYGEISGYLPPKSPHPDSILWRSRYEPAGPRGDILREQARYWGQRGIHYHQFLQAGENTLNARLALELAACIREEGGYDADRWLERYIDFMLTPGRHRDTYVEEYHRTFFASLAAGRKPRACGGVDVHIGGLVPVPAILDAMRPFEPSLPELRRIVQEHVGLTHRDSGVLRAADVLVRLLVDDHPGQAALAPTNGSRRRRRATGTAIPTRSSSDGCSARPATSPTRSRPLSFSPGGTPPISPRVS